MMASLPTRPGRILCAFLIALLAGAITSVAENEHPLAPADTSSPGATLQSFLGSLHEAYELGKHRGRSAETGQRRAILGNRALHCLDLSQIPPAIRTSVAKESGILLKEVLDRIELPPEAAFPKPGDDPTLTKWRIPHTEITIVRKTEGPREGDFLFSAETVARADEFYERIKDRPYVKRDTVTPEFHLLFMSEPGWMIPRKWVQGLPSGMRSRWMGQATWQWVGLIFTLVLSAILMGFLYLTGRRRARKVRENLPRYLITLAFPISAMLVPLGARYFVVEQLQVYGMLVVWVSVGLQVVFLFGLIVFLFGLGNRLAEAIIATPWVVPGGLDAQLTRLLCQVLSMGLALLVLVEGGRHLGIPLATLLTGASVGGLAIALAAQDTLKSILGSMAIMLAKPYRVGERIVAMGYDGVVDEIGLRSTKLRLLNGHEASIPNEEMSRTAIENITRRPHIRNSFTLELPSESSPSKLKRAVEILRGILNNHECMDDKFPPRVYLRDLKESSLGIFVVYWYHSSDYWAFLGFGERVILEMADQFAAEEIGYAAPCLDINILSEPPSDGESCSTPLDPGNRRDGKPS